MVKALYDQDLLPRVIVGSSAGALSAALVCAHKYSEVHKIFAESYGLITQHMVGWHCTSIFEFFDLLLKGKPLLKSKDLKNAVRRFTGDMTFEEVYE